MVLKWIEASRRVYDVNNLAGVSFARGARLTSPKKTYIMVLSLWLVSSSTSIVVIQVLMAVRFFRVALYFKSYK